MRTTGYAAVLRGDVDGSAPRLIAFESPASCLLATDLDRLADTWVRQRERERAAKAGAAAGPRGLGVSLVFQCVNIELNAALRSVRPFTTIIIARERPAAITLYSMAAAVRPTNAFSFVAMIR